MASYQFLLVMNILFFTTNQTYTNEIVRFLSVNNNVFPIFSKENLEGVDVFLNVLKEKSFDLVINFSDFLFEELHPICEKYQIPFFQITQNIFFIQEKSKNVNFLTHFILLSNESNTIPNILLDENYIYTLPLVFSQQTNFPKNGETSKNTKILIFITCQNLKFSPIYELIFFLNIIPNFSIHIVDNNLQDTFLNTNFQVSKINNINIDELLSETDIVIGNGDTIQRGIFMEKFCIVIGEKGYGGVINSENFKYQYENNFQGRIGGNLAESTPATLLDDDLKTFLSLTEKEKKKLLQNNKKLLTNNQNEILSSFQIFLKNKITQYYLFNNRFTDINLRMSERFRLEPISNEKFVLRNSFSGKLHSYVELDEANIIKCFGKKNTVKDVMVSNGFEEEEDMFFDFIKTLCNEKILVFV